MKTCVSCKHCSVPFKNKIFLVSDDLKYECHYYKNNDPVTGKVDYKFCSIERKFDFLCGLEGKHWEAKHGNWY